MEDQEAEKYYSLSELEELEITSSKGWLALLSTGLLIMLALLWGIFGDIPTKIKGDGIFLKGGGLYKVEAYGDGKIVTININVGGKVNKGDVIAHLDQQELVLTISENRKELKLLKKNVKKNKAKIRAVEHKLDVLNDRFTLHSKIISPYSGKVLEIRMNEGDNISRGDVVFTIEHSSENQKELEAVVYVSPLKGKKIKSGMVIQLYPSTTKAEEYGFIKGIVTQVDEYPSTYEGMLKTLQNKELVERLASGGAPIKIVADLLPDYQSYSGYKWSSSKGPKSKIVSGTIITSSVTVKKQPPITLVLPILKKVLMGKGAK